MLVPQPRVPAVPQPPKGPGGMGGTGALHLSRGAGARAALTPSTRPPRSHDKGPEAEEGVELQEGECSRGAGLRPAPGAGPGGAQALATADRRPYPPWTVGGDGPGAEEQTAVAIASVQQAAFSDHNIQYQFRTENNGGQVRGAGAGGPRRVGLGGLGGARTWSLPGP